MKLPMETVIEIMKYLPIHKVFQINKTLGLICYDSTNPNLEEIDDLKLFTWILHNLKKSITIGN